MEPLIFSGQLCTVEPFDKSTLKSGDIVLCRVGGNQYLHRVLTVKGERVLIGNNRGVVNGWVTRRCIYGRLTKVED